MRSRVFKVAGTLFLCLVSAYQVASAEWIAKGRKVAWKMTVPDSWIGGNYLQIKRREKATKDPQLKTILKVIQIGAKTSDCFLVHRPSLARGLVVTAARISVEFMEGEGFSWAFEEEVERKKGWEYLRQGLEREHPPGSKMEFVDEVLGKTGGYASYEAVYKLELPKAKTQYHAYHWVLLGSKGIHLFKLVGDKLAITERYKEFVAMILSVEYEGNYK